MQESIADDREATSPPLKILLIEPAAGYPRSLRPFTHELNVKPQTVICVMGLIALPSQSHCDDRGVGSCTPWTWPAAGPGEHSYRPVLARLLAEGEAVPKVPLPAGLHLLFA